MKAGDIALASLQQADREYKLRPVLLLKKFPPFGDWLVCGISSQIRHQVPETDVLIRESEDDFSDSGLQISSIIRIGFLATLPAKDSPGAIEKISSLRYNEVLNKLIAFLSNK